MMTTQHKPINIMKQQSNMSYYTNSKKETTTRLNKDHEELCEKNKILLNIVGEEFYKNNYDKSYDRGILSTEVESIVDNLSVDRAKVYHKWIKVGIILHNIDNTSKCIGEDTPLLLKKWHHWGTQKGSKFEKEPLSDYKQKWDNFKKMENGLKIGTLIMYAKNDSGKTFSKKQEDWFGRCVIDMKMYDSEESTQSESEEEDEELVEESTQSESEEEKQEQNIQLIVQEEEKKPLKDKMEFTEQINLENARKVSLLTQKEFQETFQLDNWEKTTADGRKYSTTGYYNCMINYLKKVVEKGESKYKKKYKYAIGQTKGRIYAIGTGLQGVPKSLKCYLLQGVKVSDYDIVNASFKILQWLTKKHKLVAPLVDYYCNNRKKCLKAWGTSKIELMIIMNMDNSNKVKKSLKQFHAELNYLKEKLIVLESEILEGQQLLNEKNPKSSRLAKVWQFYENQVVQKVMKHYEKESDCITPYFDGFLGAPNLDLEKMNEISKEYGVQWSIKSTDSNIVLNETEMLERGRVEKTFKELKNFNVREYANDFFNSITEDQRKEFMYFRLKDYCLWVNYDKHNRIKSSKIMPPRLKTVISDFFLKKSKDVYELAEEMYTDDLKQLSVYARAYKELKHKFTNLKWLEDVIKWIICEELFDGNVSFSGKIDSIQTVLAFREKVFDFKIGKLRPIEKHDMVATYITYNFPEPIPEIQEEIEQLIKSIFNDDEVREYFWDYISKCLYSNSEQQFHLWSGIGGNGKGIILKLLSEALQGYLGQMNGTFLTKANTGETQSELMSCRNKRMVFVTEPEGDGKKNKLNFGFIKTLTGGDNISGRTLFCEPEEYKPNFNLFLQANTIPDLPPSQGENAVERRMVITRFENCFVSKEKLKMHTEDSKYKLADPGLKSRIERDPRYGQQFMLMMIDRVKHLMAAEIKLKVPQKCLQATKEYIEDENHVLCWIRETFFTKEDTCFEELIKNKDVIHRHKISELRIMYYEYARQNSTTNYNSKQFKTIMKSLHQCYTAYKATGRIGKSSARHIFSGLILRPDEEDDDEGMMIDS